VEKVEVRQTLSMFPRGVLNRPSEIHDALQHLSMESLLFMMAKTTREQTRIAISDYINNLRHIKPLLTGKELIEIGYAPGPIFTTILKNLKAAQLNGELSTIEEARHMIRMRFPLREHAHGVNFG
jgi:tRNA nucleotidyltransferase (CCA-adding enzyme)